MENTNQAYIAGERYCKKCLLSDFGEKEYFRSIFEYIDSIPDEKKASPGEYARRLEICKGCDRLINGMCRICGCFVEVRAVIGINYCPDTGRYW